MAAVNTTMNGERTSNGRPHSKSLENGLLPAVAEKLELEETAKIVDDKTEVMDEFEEEEPPVGEIKEDLDTLTASGSAINDLEMQLTRVKVQYRRTVIESREKMDAFRKKLGSHIKKSEPFVEIWRKARQIQELSNKAAARFDKANSQHMAAKEMIRMSESQLATRSMEEQDPSSPSPIDLAWQEMLNHATTKVVQTEKERRDSEIEHKRIMEECTRVMEEYKNTEKRLRSHIIKSKPFYEERYRCNQKLQQLRLKMQTLESQIAASKKAYAGALKKLEVLNTEIHRRRQSQQLYRLDPRKSFSTGNSPEPMRARLDVRDRERGGSGSFVGRGGGASDTESINSFQLGDLKDQFSGSTGSLPSIGASSVSEPSPSPTPEPPSTDEDNPIMIGRGNQEACRSEKRDVIQDKEPANGDVNSEPTNNGSQEADEALSDPVEAVANKLVQQTLTTVVTKLKEEQRTTNPLSLVPNS